MGMKRAGVKIARLVGMGLLALALALAPIREVHAQSAPGTGFAPTTAAALSVSNASNNVALPANGQVVWLFNTGTVTAYFKLGATSAVTAAITDIPLRPGVGILIPNSPGAYVAAITSSSTTSLDVIGGFGIPYFGFSAAAGGGGTVSFVGATSTVTSGTISVTNTFQSVLAASATRKGCLMQNNGTHLMYLYNGPNASATLTNTFQIQPGQPFSCNAPGVVITDNISLTGTSGDAFVVSAQ